MAQTFYMFLHKISEIFREIFNVFSIMDDILILGYDANDKDCSRILRETMQTCHKENLKLNKYKCVSGVQWFPLW